MLMSLVLIWIATMVELLQVILFSQFCVINPMFALGISDIFSASPIIRLFATAATVFFAFFEH